jgi:hypothetical protein
MRRRVNLIVVRNSCEFRYGAAFVGPPLALTLLMAGIALANDKHDAPAADDLALFANAFYAGADLHDNRLTLSRKRWAGRKRINIRSRPLLHQALRNSFCHRIIGGHSAVAEFARIQSLVVEPLLSEFLRIPLSQSERFHALAFSTN